MDCEIHLMQNDFSDLAVFSTGSIQLKIFIKRHGRFSIINEEYYLKVTFNF